MKQVQKTFVADSTQRSIHKAIDSNERVVLLQPSSDTAWLDEAMDFLEDVYKRNLSGITVTKLNGQDAGIDEIRNLKKIVASTGTPGRVTSLIIIDNARDLSHEAQSAMLKLLEESNRAHRFALVARGASTLLDTIYSRSRRIMVLPCPLWADSAFKSHDKESIRLAQNIVGHARNRLHGVLNGSDESLLLAKKILAVSKSERLAEIQTVKFDKQKSLDFICTIQAILDFQLSRGVASMTMHNTVLASIKATVVATERIRANANIKLTLAQLLTTI